MSWSLADLSQRLSAGLQGRYALDRELGQGGMALVFLAQDLRHDPGFQPLREDSPFKNLVRTDWAAMR